MVMHPLLPRRVLLVCLVLAAAYHPILARFL